jgi:hypothetical protein
VISYVEHGGMKIAVVSGVIIESVQDALDAIAEASYNGCARMVIKKEALPEKFFSLRTGFAGEVLQKFSNYRMKLAITGDFGSIKSESLTCFIYECNNGRQIFFKTTMEEALDALCK